jgi:hypothetical protein
MGSSNIFLGVLILDIEYGHLITFSDSENRSPMSGNRSRQPLTRTPSS